MSIDDLARASCAIYVDGRRAGTGTLVTGSHVLTADHVVRGNKPVTIRFLDGFSGEATPVERLPLGLAAEQLDIAVLELVSGTGDRPLPAKLWPAKRLPAETKAFGYPLADNPARGVWRDSRVSGAVQGGRAQLDWDEAGTLAGHSGGPACDKRSGLMAGVLVEGAETGHFDRMVPLAAVRTVWGGYRVPGCSRGKAHGHISPSERQVSRASPAAVTCSGGARRRWLSCADGSVETLDPGSPW